jgi:hypothetical protein
MALLNRIARSNGNLPRTIKALRLINEHLQRELSARSNVSADRLAALIAALDPAELVANAASPKTPTRTK